MCVYGLADASREWYNCVVDTMKKLQCVASEFDPCIFVARANGTLIGFFAIHVDFFWAGNVEFVSGTLEALKKT